MTVIYSLYISHIISFKYTLQICDFLHDFLMDGFQGSHLVPGGLEPCPSHQEMKGAPRWCAAVRRRRCQAWSSCSVTMTSKHRRMKIKQTQFDMNTCSTDTHIETPEAKESASGPRGKTITPHELPFASGELKTPLESKKHLKHKSLQKRLDSPMATFAVAKPQLGTKPLTNNRTYC